MIQIFRQTLLMLAVLSFAVLSEAKTVVLGDVEGQWERFISFFQNSEAFEFHPEKGIILKPGYEFVFMGDALDKGDASLKIIEVLTDLKTRYPLQVQLLMGNRDTNKMRLVYELSEEGLKRPPNDRHGSSAYSDWLAANNLGSEYYSHGPTRLKWILEKTMAAPHAFEFRRSELQRQLHRSVSDQEVFNHFRTDLLYSSGALAKYLQLTEVAHADWNNRTLFIHGGISLQSIGHIPNRKNKIKDLSTWIKKLNEWARDDIRNTLKNKYYPSGVLGYQQSIPGTNANPFSLIYGRHTGASGNPEMIPLELQEMLLKQGIDTIVVGHTPVGEVPVVLSNGRFRIIFVDNSTGKYPGSASVVVDNRKVRVKARSPIGKTSELISYTHELNSHAVIGTQNADGVVVGIQNGEAISVKVTRLKNDFQLSYQTTTLGARHCVELIQSLNP